MNERDSRIHTAKVLLSESRRRGRSQFAFLLLAWAANQRRLAAQNHIAEPGKMAGQMELFA